MQLTMSPATRLLAAAITAAGLVAALAACRGERRDGSAGAMNSAPGADPAQISGSAAGLPHAARSSPVGAHFAGSASCRECHERFYQLWAPSRHGLAMQAFSAELA